MAGVDAFYPVMTASSINYGSQIGASFMILIVLLVMTPGSRFKRFHFRLHLVSLTVNLVRLVLLALYFTSSFIELYTVVTADTQFVARRDYNISVTATAFGLPVTILIELTLFVQAWSMISLWRPLYKYGATAISACLVLVTIGFDFAATVVQIRWILYMKSLYPYLWVRKTLLGVFTASIGWFCFLFIVRLLVHMYTRRTVLVNMRGLDAMDVLVITNGILMLVPAVFASLQWGSWTNFESGSLTQTSVIVVLPLGALVAQRISSAPSQSGSGGLKNSGGSYPSGSGSRGQKTMIATPSPSSKGSAWSRRALLSRGSKMTTSTATTIDTTPTRTGTAGTEGKGNVGHFDMELARIDDEDLEHGHGPQVNGVRVDRDVRVESEDSRGSS
ncbi:fungal pheromone mating factor STE2 GPCR-domain-containing protein [Diplogelasinospora grovesii]|uniref:Fungal pheromone mating factor STE2 GPCR-domain-containing protein n=1 Tax=Diplogelasinospora grovesii TaxID=303347 RepID=A0AAN6S7M7_9PEZI|nr:fungal pheromone mating factor STE2 GPCR-domain-containing protein [Diplogelasinospora grovesii]